MKANDDRDNKNANKQQHSLAEEVEDESEDE